MWINQFSVYVNNKDSLAIYSLQWLGYNWHTCTPLAETPHYIILSEERICGRFLLREQPVLKLYEHTLYRRHQAVFSLKYFFTNDRQKGQQFFYLVLSRPSLTFTLYRGEFFLIVEEVLCICFTNLKKKKKNSFRFNKLQRNNFLKKPLINHWILKMWFSTIFFFLHSTIYKLHYIY